MMNLKNSKGGHMSVTGIRESVQYLTFKLSDETFALDVSKVREILEFSKVTKVPQTPEFMRGVINLRGSVVPVIDMRLKFGMSAIEQTVNTCIIVVEVQQDGDVVILGTLADSVQEVIEMEPEQIEAAPHIGTRLNTDFIKGMGKHDGRFIMILDIDKVFSGSDIMSIQEKELLAA
jgi:purine-binding chemotaxis protein CheW